MRKFIILAFASLCVLSCKKEGPSVSPEIGSWELVEVGTKSVNYGSTAVTVFLNFSVDGAFKLYQVVGEGRARTYTGTYTFVDGVLKGTYSDNKSWASSYNAEFENDKMILTQTNGAEKNIYRKSTFPE